MVKKRKGMSLIYTGRNCVFEGSLRRETGEKTNLRWIRGEARLFAAVMEAKDVLYDGKRGSAKALERMSLVW